MPPALSSHFTGFLEKNIPSLPYRPKTQVQRSVKRPRFSAVYAAPNPGLFAAVEL